VAHHQALCRAAALSDGVIDKETEISLGPAAAELIYNRARALRTTPYFKQSAANWDLRRCTTTRTSSASSNSPAIRFPVEQLVTYPRGIYFRETRWAWQNVLVLVRHLDAPAHNWRSGHGISTAAALLSPAPNRSEEVANFQPRVKRHLDSNH